MEIENMPRLADGFEWRMYPAPSIPSDAFRLVRSSDGQTMGAVGECRAAAWTGDGFYSDFRPSDFEGDAERSLLANANALAQHFDALADDEDAAKTAQTLLEDAYAELEKEKTERRAIVARVNFAETALRDLHGPGHEDHTITEVVERIGNVIRPRKDEIHDLRERLDAFREAHRDLMRERFDGATERADKAERRLDALLALVALVAKGGA